MKTNVNLLLHGVFSRLDSYRHGGWRRVQNIPTLYKRDKWTKVRRDFQIGGIVLLKDNATRNHELMAKIIKAYKRSSGHVQTNKIQVGESTLNNEKLPKTLVHPIHETQLLVENQIVWFLGGEAWETLRRTTRRTMYY